jgi:hypothetical protein
MKRPTFSQVCEWMKNSCQLVKNETTVKSSRAVELATPWMAHCSESTDNDGASSVISTTRNVRCSDI